MREMTDCIRQRIVEAADALLPPAWHRDGTDHVLSHGPEKAVELCMEIRRAVKRSDRFASYLCDLQILCTLYEVGLDRMAGISDPPPLLIRFGRHA